MLWVRETRSRFRDCARLLADERGTVTAEFVVVLPVVVIVLGLVVGGILLSTHRISLVSLAGEIARAEARGDDAAAAAVLARVGGGVTVQRSQEGPLHCVNLRSAPGHGMLTQLGISANSCAAVS